MNEVAQTKLSGKRELLAKKLPIDMPYSVQICITDMCNLRCQFCIHAMENEPKNIYRTMPFEIVQKFAEDVEKNGKRIKQIMLSGIGEPLLHKDITKIVDTLSCKAAIKTAIVTNGTLLTHQLSDQLLEAGLSVLRVSLNGLTKEDYKNYTGREYDPEKIYENLKYFYQQAEKKKVNGEKCKIYVKIMNYMLDNHVNGEKYFIQKYSQVADIVNVESLNIVSPDIDYSNIASVDLENSRRGTEKISANICPRPFYESVISSSGDVLACCHDFWTNPHKLVIGNIMKQNFIEIWDSELFNNFRCKMLDVGVNGVTEICNKCAEWIPLTMKEDILDEYALDLLQKYQCKNRSNI